MRVLRSGDAALTIVCGEKASADLAMRIAGLQHAIEQTSLREHVECVPGLTSLTVLFDPDAISSRDVTAVIEGVATARQSTVDARHWHIPVCYDSDFALDVELVAHATGLTASDVIGRHAAKSYAVYVIGFSPGFPYLGDLDVSLALPRRANPRPNVPAGSVAIAREYTAIYPNATAGGWHVIGRTPVRLFDATWSTPALLRTGDVVRFEPISRAAFDAALDNPARLQPTV